MRVLRNVGNVSLPRRKIGGNKCFGVYNPHFHLYMLIQQNDLFISLTFLPFETIFLMLAQEI